MNHELAESLGGERQAKPDPLVAAFSAEIRLALDQLSKASRYSEDLGCNRWEFSVEIDRLLAVGINISDLRWLAKLGILDHRRESTTPDAPNRTFTRAERNLAFGKATCFVLTDKGIAVMNGSQASLSQPSLCVDGAVATEPPILTFLDADRAHSARENLPFEPIRSEMGQSQSTRAHADRPYDEYAVDEFGSVFLPNWDRVARILMVGESVVKRYRVPSPNQEALLDAFQEEGWPASIDDPLTPLPDKQPKRRLRDTIKCLNLNQATPVLRFRGDGTGQRVLWELVARQVSADPMAAGEADQTQHSRRAA